MPVVIRCPHDSPLLLELRLDYGRARARRVQLEVGQSWNCSAVLRYRLVLGPTLQGRTSLIDVLLGPPVSPS